MRYSSIAEAYEKIEATTKRLEMTDYLVEILKETPTTLIDKVVYLTQGKLYPDFTGTEIGIAEKLAVRAVARAAGHKETDIETDVQKTGDLGETTQRFMEKKTQSTFFSTPLTVERVYETLDKIANFTGSGSIDTKLAQLAGLLSDASPSEAKYIVRTVTGSLRLGIADMTVLDGLAVAQVQAARRRRSSRRYSKVLGRGGRCDWSASRCCWINPGTKRMSLPPLARG